MSVDSMFFIPIFLVPRMALRRTSRNIRPMQPVAGCPERIPVPTAVLKCPIRYMAWSAPACCWSTLKAPFSPVEARSFPCCATSRRLCGRSRTSAPRSRPYVSPRSRRSLARETAKGQAAVRNMHLTCCKDAGISPDCLACGEPLRCEDLKPALSPEYAWERMARQDAARRPKSA